MDMDNTHSMDGGMDMGGDSTGGDMDMGDMGDYMMKMWFHFGVNEIVLFDFWHPKDTNSMAYSCVILFVMSFLYEGLKYFREDLYKSKSAPVHHGERGASGSTEALSRRSKGKSWASQVFSTMHVIQTVLHALQFFVSYLLMLVFMTYNGWLCLAVLLGATFGFFVFGWKKQNAVEVTEHCH